MIRAYLVTLIVLAVTMAVAPKSYGDIPTPVDVVCPICNEHFVYVGLNSFRDSTTETCPWCLFSATAPHLLTVHPDDVDSLREVLSSPEQSLVTMTGRATGVDFAEYVGEPPRMRALQDLLALICADARRDLDVDSVTMTWLIMTSRETPSGEFIRRRFLDAMVKEKDGPFDVSRFGDTHEATAFADRLAIERREYIAMLHREFGEHEKADAMLKRVIDLVEAWDEKYGDDGFAWSNQVRMISERARGKLNRMPEVVHQPESIESAEIARQAELEIAEQSLERALARPLYREEVVSELELNQESPYGFRQDELADILGDGHNFEMLEAGDKIVVPNVPDYYMADRWPAWSMWRDLGDLIENGSETGVRTVIRWLPTLGEQQLKYDSGRDEFFGHILAAIHQHPETWPIVIDAQPEIKAEVPTTCLRAVRACAGDKLAVDLLIDLLHDQNDWGTSANIALVALSICQDRSLLEPAVDRFAAADYLAKSAIGEYIAAVGRPGDLPRLTRAARQIRARLAPDGARAAPKSNLFAINRFESAIRQIRLRSLYNRTLSEVDKQ